MNKTHTLLLFFFFITLSIYAQNPLPNPGFDSWTTVGIYEDPNNWSTLNSSTAIVGVLTALKASGADVHSGTNAIKLITKNVLGQNANGIATTGTINTTTQTINGGIAYTGRPDSITGWYKYTSVGGDNGFVAFVLLDAFDDTVGFANFTTPASNVGNYTYFSTAIDYHNASTPAVARCLLSSSAGFTAVVNSTLFIDDLGLIFNSTGTSEELPVNETTLKYYASSQILSVRSQSIVINHAEILDLSGRMIVSYPIHSSQSEFKIENLSQGIYLVILYDEALNTNLIKKITVE